MHATSVRSLVALLVGLVAAVTACGARAGVIEDIQARGKIIIGLSTFVPWAMRAKNGEIIGFEIDVGRKLAEDMKSQGKI